MIFNKRKYLYFRLLFFIFTYSFCFYYSFIFLRRTIRTIGLRKFKHSLLNKRFQDMISEMTSAWVSCSCKNFFECFWLNTKIYKCPFKQYFSGYLVGYLIGYLIGYLVGYLVGRRRSIFFSKICLEQTVLQGKSEKSFIFEYGNIVCIIFTVANNFFYSGT